MFSPTMELLTLATLAILLSHLSPAARAAGPSDLPPTTTPAPPVLIYVGTYTSPDDQGIQLLRLDPASGKLTALGLVAELPNPSFLALSPNRKFLAAVSEAATGPERHGSVATYAIDPATGQLTGLSRQDSTGTDPCHLVFDPLGQHVLLANYSTGNIAVLPIDATGHLGQPSTTIQHPAPTTAPSSRQKGPHAHGVYFGPTQQLLLVPDLGLDQVLLYDYQAAKGTLAPANPPAIQLPPGSGPRHLTFDPTGRFLYIINELTSTITALQSVTDLPVHPPLADEITPPIPTPFTPGTPGASFRAIQTISTLPPNFTASSASELVIHPSGRFLFASNRGHDSIAVFARDPATGRLTLTGHFPTRGKSPRHFTLDPTGTLLLVANQTTNNITVFRLDPTTGALTFTGENLKIHAPVCLLPLGG